MEKIVDPKAIVNNLISSLFWAIVVYICTVITLKRQINSVSGNFNKSAQSGTANRDPDAG